MMDNWTQIGRLMIGAGIFFILMGLIVFGGSKFFNFGRLPGDIFIQRGNFTFFFPLVTCIILSLLLTVILNLFFWNR